MITEEDKKLLLRDLCARQPYGVKCYTASYKQPYTLIGIVEDEIFLNTPIHDEGDGKFDLGHEIIKPYLRPMSSMTDSEYKEYEEANDLDTLDSSETLEENLKAKSRVRISKWYHGVDWLNAHHFDYRGLIPMGLAFEAPKDMYKTK